MNNLLNYKIIGEGKKIVFLHGFMEDLSIWEEFNINKIPNKKILINLPGHGSSIYFDNNWKNLKDIAQFIYNNCDVLKIEDNETVDIVGHSLGAYIGIELHKLLPKPGKLVFYHSHFLGDNDVRKINRERAIALVNENKNSFIRESIPLLFRENNRANDYVKRLIKIAQSVDKDVIIFYLSAMKIRSNEKDYILKNLKDIFFIHGKYDTLLTESELKIVSDIVKIYTIEDVAHQSFMENSKSSLSLIKKILAK